MGKKSTKAPNAPDPAQSIKAQAEANRINQYTPQGNQLYGTVNKQGKFVPSAGGQAAMVLEETPYQKQARTIGESTSIKLANALSPQASHLQQVSLANLPQRTTSLDFSKIGAIPGMDQFGDQAKQAQDAYFQQGMGLLQPGMDLDQRRLDQKLADRGLPLAGEAYTGAQDQLGQAQGMAKNQLALASVGAGNDRANQLYQQAMQSRAGQIGDQLTNAQLAEAARTGGLGEQQAIRAQQLGELASLLGGQTYNPTPTANFTAPGMIDVTGPTNAAYNAQLAQWQNGQNQQAGMMNGLFSIGTAALL